MVLIHVYQTFSQTKNKGKQFLVAKSSGPLLARMALNFHSAMLAHVVGVFGNPRSNMWLNRWSDMGLIGVT